MYKVNQQIAILNIGDVLSEEDVNRIFSQNIKESLILDNVIEEVKEMEVVKGYTILTGGRMCGKNWYEFRSYKDETFNNSPAILIQNPTPEIEKAIYDIMNPTKPEPDLQSKKLFLRCIDNDGRKNYLTKNKIYLSEGTDDIFYFIRNDKGSREFYHSPRFQLITNKVVKCETDVLEFATKGNYYEVTNINGYVYSIIADGNKIQYVHKSNFSEVQ